MGQRGLALYLLLLVVGGWATGVWLDDWVQREPELYRRDQLATVWLKLGSAEASPWALALAWLTVSDRAGRSDTVGLVEQIAEDIGYPKEGADPAA